MSLSFLGPLHPQIVHTPIVMLIFSAVLALAGRLLDRDWLRKTSVLMLVLGFFGAFFAVQSGKPAHKVPEHDQGVPEQAIDEHAEGGERVMYLAGAALVLIGIASKLKGSVANAVGILALLLQIGAAVLVGITARRGGDLVYAHGANVKVDGQLVKSANAGKKAMEEGNEKGGKPESDER